MAQKFSKTRFPRYRSCRNSSPSKVRPRSAGAGVASVSQMPVRPVFGASSVESRSNWPVGGASNGLATTSSAPSVMRNRWSAGMPRWMSTLPEGQNTLTSRISSSSPKPKCTVRDGCERKPEPLRTDLVRCRPDEVSKTSRAPTASRLLAVPSSRKATEWWLVGRLLRSSRSWGEFLLLSRMSVSPSRSKSKVTKARPSSGKSSPATADRSANVPSPRFQYRTFRSCPLRLPLSRISLYSKAQLRSYCEERAWFSGEDDTTCRQKKLQRSGSSFSVPVTKPLTM